MIHTYKIHGMTCNGCRSHVEQTLSEIEGVSKVSVNLEKAEAAKLELLLKEMNAEETTQNAVATMAASEDIKVQRENFEPLSMGMEKMLQGTLKSGMLYKQYCPMAFNNKGAYWISSSRDILNPYFGDKMLKCGRVDAEIK